MDHVTTLVNAFSYLGTSSLKHDHQDGYVDVRVLYPEGIEDVFHVQLVDDRIEWIDFTHTTDLGPSDGSELLARLSDWSVSKGLA